MKKYTSKIALLLATAVTLLSSCSDEAKREALAEPVPLRLTLNATDFVMGESLDLSFEVTGTEEGKREMNEELTIRMSATTQNGAVDQLLFDNFPSTVVLPKGVSSHMVQIPIKKEGLNRQYSVDIAAFARGYRLAGALQTITVSDYHYARVQLKNNADNSVREGQTFVLIASVSTTVPEDLIISIAPNEDEQDRYEGLPNQLIIPAGSSEIESLPITMVNSTVTTEDEILTLNLTSSVARYPLISENIKIKKIDPHGGLKSEVEDERWLYEDADQLFVSPRNLSAVTNWGQNNYVVMNEGDPHPNSGKVLPEGKWKFYRAYEFHKIANCLTTKMSNDGLYTSHEYPYGFADQNTEAVESAGAVDNAKYAWVMDEGYLRLLTLREKTTSTRNGKTMNFGTSAFYSCKFMRGNANAPTWATSNVRIYPGMRIETRARVRGVEMTGMLPGIWLQGNEQVSGNPNWSTWPDFGEIDVMENNSTHGSASHRTAAEQTFHLGNGAGVSQYSPTVAVTQIAGTIDQFHIYWMEWVDDETVRMGVNGAETIVLTKAAVESRGAKWPFAYQINSEGLHYILSMMFLRKSEPNWEDTQMNTTYSQARNILKSDPTAKIPRLEIDWVRFYTDDSYSDYGMPFRKDIILY